VKSTYLTSWRVESVHICWYD